MAWRLATSLDVLRKEVNAAHPNRPKASDGTIGDVAHQNQGSASDHNPWLNNTVRAWDITTADFTDALAEWLRLKGKAGDPRLVGGGYVIYKGRICSDNDSAGAWNWRKYTGGDPHTSHIHLSVTRNPAYDDASPWGVVSAPTPEDTVTEETAKAILDQLKKIAEDAHESRMFLGPMNENLTAAIKESAGTVVDAIKSKD